jgi:hypothetical protein
MAITPAFVFFVDDESLAFGMQRLMERWCFLSN